MTFFWEMMIVTERQKIFVDEYILTGNGAEAARRAGYAASTANRAANKLLSSEQSGRSRGD